MSIKSSRGMSSVKAPKMSPKAKPNTGIIVTSGKAIVQKPINKHNANPGFKKGK